MADNPKPGSNFIFGKKTEGSDHVPGVLKYPAMSKLAEYNNDLCEAKYGSHKREPLGKPMTRNYVMPEKVMQEEFRFGQHVIPSEPAKNVLFPEGGEKHETPRVAAMYLKTHGTFEPGQQKERNYNWPIDKKNHRFGYIEEREADGAAKCVKPERFGESFPETKIVKKTVEDYIEVTKDELGKHKNLGQQSDPNQVFGAMKRKEEWNAAMCIYGVPETRNEVDPEPDLGRCTKMNCTNAVRRPEDTDRAFGVPTIRNDIPKKARKSVADPQNYGDEPEAVKLLFPSSYLEFGITEEDFNAPRSREEIKTIFENIGFQYKIGKFNAMFSRAQQYGESGEVSVRTFLAAVKELHFVE
eukprot:TRINITY_DN769_c0_g3_i2.p1 TRINITY_DN769_c0_g3~~TRINITY_DN769_c0_g3_i2.p1  ORF type:complete len:355 (-),score=127.26 TRINITY_DN769_c0_g3_i2:138-1202(-)